MEETPDIPELADDGPVESRPYTMSHRLIAAGGLIGCAFLLYVFMDVMAGGRLSRMLSTAPGEAEE